MPPPLLLFISPRMHCFVAIWSKLCTSKTSFQTDHIAFCRSSSSFWICSQQVELQNFHMTTTRDVVLDNRTFIEQLQHASFFIQKMNLSRAPAIIELFFLVQLGIKCMKCTARHKIICSQTPSTSSFYPSLHHDLIFRKPTFKLSATARPIKHFTRQLLPFYLWRYVIDRQIDRYIAASQEVSRLIILMFHWQPLDMGRVTYLYSDKQACM